MKVVRHRKVSEPALQKMIAEAQKIATLVPYVQFVRDTGLSLGSVNQLMCQLIREAREHEAVVHRGTHAVDIEATAAELTEGLRCETSTTTS